MFWCDCCYLYFICDFLILGCNKTHKQNEGCRENSGQSFVVMNNAVVIFLPYRMAVLFGHIEFLCTVCKCL